MKARTTRDHCCSERFRYAAMLLLMLLLVSWLFPSLLQSPLVTHPFLQNLHPTPMGQKKEHISKFLPASWVTCTDLALGRPRAMSEKAPCAKNTRKARTSCFVRTSATWKEYVHGTFKSLCGSADIKKQTNGPQLSNYTLTYNGSHISHGCLP